MLNETNPMSFANRLRGTIVQLTRETEEGQEDWTPTINRLRDTLAIEIEREKSFNPPVENDNIDIDGDLIPIVFDEDEEEGTL